MKHPAPAAHVSIFKRLSLALVTTILVVAIMSLFINFMISSRNARVELEIKSDEYATALADTLTLPIWRINEDTIEAIGKSYAQNEFVAQLQIEGLDDLVYFKSEQPEALSIISKSKDIYYKDEYVGRVRLDLSSDYYKVIDQRIFWSFSVTIIVMIAALLVVTGLLLRQLLNFPMSRFIDMVNSYADGKTDAFKEGTTYTEFLPLVDVLDKMSHTIDSQVKSLELTQHAVDNSSVAIYWVDLDAQITYANDAASQITGYSLEELKKISLFNIEDRLTVNIWQERIEKLKLEGSFSFESVHASNNSKMFPVEVTATHFEFFEQEYICAFVSDITKRKKAEMGLRESRDFLKNLTDAIGDVVFSIKMPEREIEWVSDRFDILGYTPEECLGKRTDFFYANKKNYLTVGERMSKASTEGKDLITTEAYLRRKNGEIFPAEATLSLIRVNNEVVSIIGTLRDISIRKNAELKILEYQKRLKALASQLAITEERERRSIAVDLHDNVAQSLALMRMQIASVDKHISEPIVRRKLEDISGTLLQTLQETRNLMLDLSSPSMSEIGLSAAIAEWLEVNIVKRYNLKAEFSDNTKEHALDFLKEDMRVILFRNVRELLVNIVKHAQAEHVSVDLQIADDKMKITVTDDGTGFDSSTIKRENGTDSSFGLFSIKERMSDAGGTFEIISEPNKGCTTIMTVPVDTVQYK